MGNPGWMGFAEKAGISTGIEFWRVEAPWVPFFFSQDRNAECGGLCMKREMDAEKTYWKKH